MATDRLNSDEETQEQDLTFRPTFVLPSVWLKVLYHLQFAEYVSSLGFLFLGWTTKVPQHEKVAMVIQHLVMIMLVGFCWSSGEYRMGSLILLLHDVSTPFAELSNMARYIGWTDASNLLYTIYALAFLLTRMILFPLRVILALPMHFPASVYYAFTTCGHPAANGGCLAEPLFTVSYYYVWMTLFSLLYLTYLQWAVFISKSTKLSLYTSSSSSSLNVSGGASSGTSSPTHKDASPRQTMDEPDGRPKPRKLNNSQRPR